MKMLMLAAFVWLSVQTHAQLKGMVTDSLGRPLPDAYVENKRSHLHAHTNEAGNFMLAGTVAGDSLLVSHIAYRLRTVVLRDTGFVRIPLVSTSVDLNEVVVRSGANHLNIIADIDTKTNPVNSSQELLRRVPGLFIGQHAGGGKAEQLFLRGFDVDHGTDINISVDGMPVNMVSHAHGQGYADLHFLIPETVDRIAFEKGPYDAGKGNLATAGYVAFKTKDRLDQPGVNLELGNFNTQRLLALTNLVTGEKQSAYIAAEALHTDGYFDAPQRFYRFNFMGKYTAKVSDADRLSFSVSHLSSKWNASGQIPDRAVNSGSISRFGSIDSTEGGSTQRTNIILQHQHTIDPATFIKTNFYYTRYAFDLYSNFTFFLNDPVNGDEIRQKEVRDMVGFESVLNKQFALGDASLQWQTGVGLRYDQTTNTELSHAVARRTIGAVQLGDITEQNLFGYTGVEWRRGRWLAGLATRIDYLNFGYDDHLSAGYRNLSAAQAIVSPKFNLLYAVNNNLQYFLKAGKGFHSNDTRVITMQTGRQILPASYGADLGATWKPFTNVVVNTALWYLYMQQEFVYVGDEGIVEPGGRTQRKGVDLGLRWQLTRSLFLNSDLTYSRARAIDEPKGNDYMSLAPVWTYSGGLSYNSPSGWAGSVKTRWLGSRPANEDNSIIAKGYAVTDLNLSYSFRHVSIGAVIQNLFNTSWNETQFATTSRLYNEPQPVTEIHFTPGTPFNARVVLSYRF